MLVLEFVLKPSFIVYPLGCVPEILAFDDDCVIDIELPLSRSGIASAGIFAFLISWNEYALVSNLARSTDSKTLTVGLMDFTAQFTINWPGMCALAVFIIIPALILTFMVQKHLVTGLTFGGVKG